MQWWGGERAKEPIRKAMQLIQKVPEKERLYIQGMNEVIEDNINEAIVIYKKLLTLYPDEKEALYQVGDYSFHKTDYDTAVAYLGKVLNLDPLFERAYQHLIWTYGAMGKYDRALGLCKQYVAKVPGGMSYCLLGENYTRSNNFSDAFKTYRKALEIFPDNKMIIQGLGETYIFNNEYLGLVISPLTRTKVVPDVVQIYCLPAQAEHGPSNACCSLCLSWPVS